MRRPATRLRPGVADRLDHVARRDPEWRAWLSLLREIAPALDDPALQACVDAAPGDVATTPPAPLLHRRIVRVDLRALTGTLTRLLKTASSQAPAGAEARSLARYLPNGEEARRLVEAVVRHDDDVITATAHAEDVDPGALAAVARVAVVPLLAAAARELSSQVPAHWAHGYCPVCGSWPLLGELRGVERGRWLRCGRCATAWRAAWLRCTYCGETSHPRLGALAAADGLESRKAETCATCHQYLKSIATLAPLPHLELLLADLETVELDLAAHGHNFARPAEPGYRIECAVAPAHD